MAFTRNVYKRGPMGLKFWMIRKTNGLYKSKFLRRFMLCVGTDCQKRVNNKKKTILILKMSESIGHLLKTLFLLLNTIRDESNFNFCL